MYWWRIIRSHNLRDQFKLQQWDEECVSELQDLLLPFKLQIVHFSGRGIGESALLFENDYGDAEIAMPTALADLISK